MTVKVLVVDDSGFFRRRVSQILDADPNLKVVDTAANGQEALDKISQCRPDVVTMDIEMPVMDGITAVRHIMRRCPVPVIMFSSLTYDGARATLDALEAGAADFLPKRFEDIAGNRADAARLLQQRVLALASQRRRFGTSPGLPRSEAPAAGAARAPVTLPTSVAKGLTQAGTSPRAGMTATAVPQRRPRADHKVLLIGASTGGPVALQKILTALPANFPVPIVLVQHMPATFTSAFAQRLDSLCQLRIKEAETGDQLVPGWAYLAPGGKQMLLEGRGGHGRIGIRPGEGELNYNPSVDVTFGSAARLYGGQALGVILTGMGADGREGCRMLRGQGATIWSQDAQSCVVYGMPSAVDKAGLSHESVALNRVAERLLQEFNLSSEPRPGRG